MTGPLELLYQLALRVQERKEKRAEARRKAAKARRRNVKLQRDMGGDW